MYLQLLNRTHAGTGGDVHDNEIDDTVLNETFRELRTLAPRGIKQLAESQKENDNFETRSKEDQGRHDVVWAESYVYVGDDGWSI